MFNLVPFVQAVNIEDAFQVGSGPVSRFGTLSAFISPLLKNVFVLAGVILFVLLVLGGLMYIINAGSGDKEGMERGKNALTAAVLGFIIIFVAYWIIQIIEFITGVEIFYPK